MVLRSRLCPRSARIAPVLLVVIGHLAMVAGPASAATPSDPVVYRPPVDGVVVDGFRPPSNPYGPGNRGIEYSTDPGAVVVAAAGGKVVFAGPVAGSLHVTVAHSDGLRTSYSFLASIDVLVGAAVDAGTPVGTSGGRVHFGVREGDRYLDPAAMIGVPRIHVRLVPEPAADASGTRAEGLELLPIALDAGLSGLDRRFGVSDHVAGLMSAAADLGRRADARFAPFAHYALELSPAVRHQRIIRRFASWWVHRDECTAPDQPASPGDERRIVVLVGGLGTSSERAAVDRVDTVALGYADDDVVRFSYAGGRTPGRPPAGPLTAIGDDPYDAHDTQGDLTQSARRLRELLVAISARQPGVPIDVVAHSQGGVVAQLASSRLVDPAALPAEVDLVATMGSPHDGADLATAASALSATGGGRAPLARLEDELGLGLDPLSPSISQLSESSSLMRAVVHEPPPPGVRLLALAARGDLTVPATHTYLPGAAHHTIDLTGRDAHTILPGDPATTRELALALEGRPPTCQDATNVMTDLVSSEAISYTEDLIGLTAALLAV